MTAGTTFELHEPLASRMLCLEASADLEAWLASGRAAAE